jgi:hypothetical protein
MNQGKATSIDWAAIEREYRVGIKSLRQIAEEHCITHGAIQKRVKKYGWVRDLRARIHARADALVASVATGIIHAESAKSEEAKPTVAAPVATKGATPDTEDQTVEVNAAVQASVRLKHRQYLERAAEVVIAQIGELRTLSVPALQEALEAVLRERQEGASIAKSAALQRAFDSALELSTRAAALHRSVASLSTVIKDQRQAHGIDKDKEDSVEDAMVAAIKLLGEQEKLGAK